MPPASGKFAGIFHSLFTVFLKVSGFFPELCIAYPRTDHQRNGCHIAGFLCIFIILSIAYGKILCGFCRNLEFCTFQSDTSTLRKNFCRENGSLFSSFEDIFICSGLLAGSDKPVIQMCSLSLAPGYHALQPHNCTVHPAPEISICIVDMTELCPCILISG